MNTSKRSFMFPIVLFFFVFIALIWLGQWQLDRADYKRGIEQAIEHAQSQQAIDILNLTEISQQAFFNVFAKGHYDNQHQYLLDNRTFNGVAGYHVYTPFKLNNGQAILVNRGWITYQKFRENIPEIGVAEQEMTIKGRLNNIPESFLLTKEAPSHTFPKIVQSIAINEITKDLGYSLLPMCIELAATQNEGFERGWPTFYGSVNTHLSYALQWFTMAAVLLLIFIINLIKMIKNNKRKENGMV